MAARQRRRTARRDVDGAWKGVLRDLFPEFVAFTHPQLHAAIDWTRAPEFQDKELQAVARQAATGRRFVDLLVKVWEHTGQERWLLVHVEVQARRDPGFAARMYAYYSLLTLRYRRPVVSLAVLIDTDPAWRPGDHRDDAWGCGVQFHYPTLKLLDLRGHEDELAAMANPFAQVALAQLAVLTAGRQQAPLAEVRRVIMRRLLRAGYTAEQVVAVVTFLDWILGLPDDLSAQIDAEVAEMEGVTMTRLISRWEREITERVTEDVTARVTEDVTERVASQSLVAGQREIVLWQLDQKVGPLSASIRHQIAGLSHEQLLALSRALLDFTALADLQTWLAANPPATR